MKHNLTLTISINVDSDLPIQDLIDQFGSETDYEFKSTDDVKIISTEIIEVC